MHIYVVRHASYFPKELDPQEGLDEAGRKQAEQLGFYLKQARVHPELILHSPKTRAKQTAELLNFNTSLLKESKNLNPLTPPKETLEEIPKGLSSVILVGHRPNVQEVAKLFGYDLLFEPASCAYITDATLQWYITPAITCINVEL